MASVADHLGRESVDAVYCAHRSDPESRVESKAQLQTEIASSPSLEHLQARQASKSLEGFWSVLKPGGVVLVAVPDAQARKTEPLPE